MNIYISSDHGGFEVKNFLIDNLGIIGVVLTDLGPSELNEDDDYPDFAFPLASKVASDKDSLGILICRSGNGMVIAANKVKGAYAALCFSETHAEKARADDNANIICLDADYQNKEELVSVVHKFLETSFSGFESRHGRRFNKIVEYENKD